MTMTELLKAIVAAQAEAREHGATDDEVSEIRRRMIAENRQEATSQEYANQWTPGVPPVPEPPHEPINPGRTKELWYDRF